MELQRRAACQGYNRRFGLNRQGSSGRQVVIWAMWLLCSALLWASLVQAQSTSYVYDANGRVVAVTASNGTSVQYSYDTLGHTDQVGASLAPGKLAIFAFMPSHGEAGTQLSIQGQGFSSTAANDTVSFNGTVATVLSASATQLLTTVPSGATTGPISVTVGSQTAASAVPFIVDSTGVPPTITLVNPTMVSVGNTVTITGTDLDPVSGGTTVQLGGVTVVPSSVSNTQLQFVVPASATGGNVVVTTPYGRAVSSATVLVLPSAIAPSNIVSSGNTTINGSAVNLAIASSGQVGVVEFSGTTGSWLSVQLTNITTTASSIAYTVYGPGNTVFSQGTVSSTSPSIHLPQLTASGTYYATFQPSGAGAQLSVSVLSNIMLTGAPLSFTATVPYQSVRMLFTAAVNQNLELTLNGVAAIGGAANQFAVYVNTTSGAQVAAFNCYQSNPGSSCQQHLWNMAAGTYTITVVPNHGGTLTFNMLLQPDTVMPQLTFNNSVPLSLAAGQVERFTVNATAGQSLTLNVMGTTTKPAAAYTGVTFMVFRPDTGIPNLSAPYVTFNSSGYSGANLPNLPVSGAYTIVVAPDYGLAVTGQITVAAASTSNLTANGAATNLSASVGGQNLYLSFTATQGENLELTLNNATITGSTNPYYNVNVYSSAGAQVASSGCSTQSPAGSCELHLWSLGAGVYTVIVSPTQNANGTISANALLQDDVVGSAIPLGGSVALNLGAGQAERFTFNASVGQTLALNLSNVTTTPGGQGVKVSIYRPDAGTITGGTGVYTSFDTGGNQLPTANLPNLPVSGIYTVIVSPDYGLPMSGQLNLASGVTGALAIDAQAQPSATSFTNQGAYFTFTAQAGDNLELTLNNIAFSGTSSPLINVTVNTSTGQQVTSAQCSPGTTNASCDLHLWNLGAGTYSVIMTPNSGGAMSFNTLLLRDIVGPTLTATTPVNLALGAGQVERVTFNATIGQTVALEFSGVATTPSIANHGVDFLVYSPQAGTITRGSSVYASVDMTGTQALNLPNLPATGTYTIIIAPDGGVPATAQLNLVAGITGSVQVGASQQNYATSTSGQNAYLTFVAQEGDNLELTGIGQQGSAAASVFVYNAAGSQIASFSATPGNPGFSGTASLWDLPAGTYSIIVAPYYGAGGGITNVNLLLQPDIVGSVLTQGATTNAALGAGQVERYTFNAGAGDTVTLQFPQMVTTPSGVWFTANVYRPDVGTITNSTTVYSSSNLPTPPQTITLTNLPVGGVYTVIIRTIGGVPGTAEIGFSDTAGSGPIYTTTNLPSDGTLQSETGSAAGQSVTLTFNATAGQLLEFTLSGINVPGASVNGVRVDLYNSAGTDLVAYNCYASSPGGACNHGLYAPVAGTYKAVVSTQWGGTLNFNAQVEPWTYGPALSANTPVSVNFALGQTQTYTFNANAGASVALSLANVSTAPNAQSVTMFVARPDQGEGYPVYASTSANNGASAVLNLPNLPVSGTYTVIIQTAYGGPMTGTLTLLSSAPVQLVENASAQSVAAAAPGQNIYATFTANQGDNLELQLANMAATNGSNYSTNVTIFGPSGNQYTSSTCYQSWPGNGCRLSLWNLPAGTYTVTMAPTSSVAMTFNLQLLTDIAGPALNQSTPTTVNLSVGQVERMTFSGTQGATYALSMSGTGTTPGGQPAYVNIYAPGSGSIGTGNYYTYTSTAGATTLNLPNLPVSGTYTVVVYTQYGEPGQVTLNLLPGVVGQIATNAATQTFSTSVAGQNAYLTFTANTGDNLELLLSNIAGSFTANVYNSNGVQVGSSLSCNATNPGSSCADSLWNLSAGIYSIVMTGGPTTFTALLASDINGPALAANTPMTVNLAAGQVERLTFNGTQGSPMAIALSGSSTAPSGQSIYACIYPPTWVAINANNICNNYYLQPYAQLNTSSSQTLNIASLPATGTYTVVIGQNGNGLPSTAQIATYTNMVGTSLSNGSIQTFAASQNSENYYTSFTANPGDDLELVFSNISVPNNSFMGALDVQVYDQNGNAVTMGQNSCAATPECAFSLWNLAGGTYTVAVNPNWGGNMNFSVQLMPDVMEPALVANTTTAITLPLGNVQHYTFNGTVGQSVSLSLSSASAQNGQPINVYVYRPDSGVITQNPAGQTQGNFYGMFQAWTSGTGALSMPYLPVSGNYTVIVESNDNVPATAQLTLSTGQNGTLSKGGPIQSIVLSASQNATLGFTAAANDNLELSLTNIKATGGNGNLALTVLDSNGNVVATGNCYITSTSAGCNLPLWNLAAGTYTTVISTTGSGSIQFNAQLQSDVVAGALTAGTPVMIGPNPAPSPVERFTFDANASANVSLLLSGINTSPAGQGMTVSVYRPDVGTITPTDAYQQMSATGANTLPLTNLPISGTYTVIVNTNGAVASAAQLMLSTP